MISYPIVGKKQEFLNKLKRYLTLKTKKNLKLNLKRRISTSIVSIENVITPLSVKKTNSSCKDLMDGFQSISNILKSYGSEYLKKSLDLQDKIISEYLTKHHKENLLFYFQKRQNKEN
ncbi:hypothetical protein DMUE_5842 [Dictyocoela muelleri]|nr:hypothetical protein DMUE_5842 [Dictyocoela muelleri]